MSLTKRIAGNYNIGTVDPDTGLVSNEIFITTNKFTVIGNLDVQGTTTEVESVDLIVTDNVIRLNDGESGAGITKTEWTESDGPLASAGVKIDRGSELPVGIRYNETTDKWQLTNDGITWSDISLGLSIADVHNDSSPALGGDLDVNGWKIVSKVAEDTNSNGITDTLDITIEPVASGELRINSDSGTGSGISIQEQASDPSSVVNYNKLYAKTPNSGGSGLFFKQSTKEDELVSKTKAIVFGIIF